MNAKQKSAIVDEYGALHARIAAAEIQIDPDRRRAEQLEAEILSWHAQTPAEDCVVEEGARFLVRIGARSLQRRIVNMIGLYKFLGQAKFLSLCSFPLGQVDKMLQPSEAGKYVEGGRTGARSLKVAEKPA